MSEQRPWHRYFALSWTDFFRGLPLFHETAQHFFIHANYDASLPLAEQP